MLTGVQLLWGWFLLVLLRRPVNDETEAAASLSARRNRRKRRLVRGLWLAYGVALVLFPVAHFVVTLGLFTTFLSFTILDETL